MENASAMVHQQHGARDFTGSDGFLDQGIECRAQARDRRRGCRRRFVGSLLRRSGNRREPQINTDQHR